MCVVAAASARGFSFPTVAIDFQPTTEPIALADDELNIQRSKKKI
jgi:hypothetical protein